MWVDEFRIRIIEKRNKFKAWLVKILKGWLGRLDVTELKKCTIDKDVSFTMSKFVPDDNQWHHIALTIDYWIKLNSDGSKDDRMDTAAYKGGEKITYDKDTKLVAHFEG